MFFEQKVGEGQKIQVFFFLQTDKYLHQRVISMGVGTCTFSSHLTWMWVWGRSIQPPEARVPGAEPQRLAIYYKN